MEGLMYTPPAPAPIGLPRSPVALSRAVYAAARYSGDHALMDWANKHRADFHANLLRNLFLRWEVLTFRADPNEPAFIRDPWDSPLGGKLNPASVTAWWARARNFDYAPAKEQKELLAEGLELVWLAYMLTPGLGPPTRGEAGRTLQELVVTLRLFDHYGKDTLSADEIDRLWVDQHSRLGVNKVLDDAAAMQAGKPSLKPLPWPRKYAADFQKLMDVVLRSRGVMPRAGQSPQERHDTYRRVVEGMREPLRGTP